jgi:hypothetical protein
MRRWDTDPEIGEELLAGDVEAPVYHHALRAPDSGIGVYTGTSLIRNCPPLRTTVGA